MLKFLDFLRRFRPIFSPKFHEPAEFHWSLPTQASDSFSEETDPRLCPRIFSLPIVLSPFTLRCAISRSFEQFYTDFVAIFAKIYFKTGTCSKSSRRFYPFKGFFRLTNQSLGSFISTFIYSRCDISNFICFFRVFFTLMCKKHKIMCNYV